MRRRVIQISRSHRQLNIERSDVNDEAAYRFEREFLEIRLRRKAAPLAHQAGHQLAVIYFSLFFVPTHIGSGFESATVIQSGIQEQLKLQAIFVASLLPVTAIASGAAKLR